MNILKTLKIIYKSEHQHFLSVEKKMYNRWRLLIKLVVLLNKNYKPCEIYRKRYKSMNNLVIIALKYRGKNVKRRSLGFAKDFVNNNRKAKCIFCEKKLTLENATTDHIIPISQGGNNCQVNLIVVCSDCNSDRGTMKFYEYLIYKNKKYSKTKQIFI